MDLKEFIEKYQEEINNREFEKVYSLVKKELPIAYVGKLTELFYKCGVDPLKYMTEVPADYASNSNISKVDIPDNIMSIGRSAFSGCSSLTSVTIGSGVKSISWSAFEYCSKLMSVTIGNGVKSIYI